MRLRDRTLPQRLLATWFLFALAAGFTAAQANLWLHHQAADGVPGLTYADVVAAFHGRPGASILTAKIAPGGSMAKNVPAATDRRAIRDWVAHGAQEQGFEPIREILARRCIRCHRPGGEMQQVPFAPSREQGPQFALVKPLTIQTSGMSWAALARSSHAHLFGLSVVFALAGGIFLLTGASAGVKGAAVSAPFVALFLDVGSWWLTKLAAPFAAGVIAGGMLMGASFAVLIVWPLAEMWWPARRRCSVAERPGGPADVDHADDAGGALRGRASSYEETP